MEFFSYRHKNREDDYEDPRRDFLVTALTMGLFAAGGRALWPTNAFAMGWFASRQLPPGQSIYRITGDVRINGVPANEDTPIGPRETIETGSNSELVFVVGKDAFMLRENSQVELSALLQHGGGGGAEENSFADSILGGLRLLSGKILTVFGVRSEQQPLSLHTTTATIGIRGTGVYLESYPGSSYVCTCYGATELTAIDDPASREEITSAYHDAPRFILGAGPEGDRIEPAPVFNHTDMELVLLEELVGREPPFAGSTGKY